MSEKREKEIWIIHGDEEIKKSLERYFKYVFKTKAETLNVKDKHLNYFDTIFPREFGGKTLYFIFDENPDTFDNDEKLSISGLIFTALVDMSWYENIKVRAYNLDLKCFCERNEVEMNKIEENTHPAGFIEMQNIKIGKYGILERKISHPHIRAKEILEKAEKILTEKEINIKNAKEYENTSEKGKENYDFWGDTLKDIIKNSVFVLLIDDVLGDYSKTFLPFYAWLKSQLKDGLKDKGKELIMRGLWNIVPSKLGQEFKKFPADIILVDIDFSKKKEQLEKRGIEVKASYWPTENFDEAGAKLFLLLHHFRETGGIYTKKIKKLSKLIIFTGIGELSVGNLKEIWIQKSETDKLISELRKYNLPDKYFEKEYEDILKKLFYLKKYYYEGLDKKLERQNGKDKIIWDIIAIKEGVEENFNLFEQLKDYLLKDDIAIYTGLERIEFDGEEKPIYGERIKPVEGDD